VVVSLIGLYQYFFSNYVEAAEGVRRILSIYDSPNHLGLFLDRVIPVLVATVAFAADRRRRIGYALALLPILAALYLTFSRGAWLVGLPAGLLAIGLLADRRTRIAVLALLGLALLALLPFASTVRFASLFNLQEGTSFNRLLIWQGSLRMIAGHPLWGVGIGNFVYEYPRYMLPEAWREPVIYHAHNLLLDFWAMLGLPGLIALVALLVAFFRTGLRAYRRLADPDLQALTLGLLASMVVVVAHGLVDTGYFLTDLAFTFMLTLALIGRLENAGR
jgi:O-antigen ligase